MKKVQCDKNSYNSFTITIEHVSTSSKFFILYEIKTDYLC